MTAPAILITGGTSGIGRATAELLLERGWRVAVTGRSPESVATARAELPGDIVVLQADSRLLEDTDRVVGEVAARFGTLAAVFLNAGISRPRPGEEGDEATWDDLFATNAKGQYFTLQKALPLLVDGGSVVFTVGIGATRGSAGASVTAGSRGALLAMVPSLAVELAPRRIRVNAVSPGAIDTPIWTRSGMGPERLAAVTASVAATVPLGRLGAAREVAATVAFLVSDEAGYITGENVVVGGGIGLTP